MAVTHKATKTSKNAELNLDLGDVKISKKTKNKTKKHLKTVTLKVWLYALLFLLIGLSVGIGTWFIICKDDCFNIIGKDELTLTLDETYTDQGVKIVAFNKDISNNVTITTNLQKDENGNYFATEIGTYYIKYTSNDFKYGKLFKVEKVRLVTFVEISESGE